MTRVFARITSDGQPRGTRVFLLVGDNETPVEVTDVVSSVDWHHDALGVPDVTLRIPLAEAQLHAVVRDGYVREIGERAVAAEVGPGESKDLRWT